LSPRPACVSRERGRGGARRGFMLDMRVGRVLPLGCGSPLCWPCGFDGADIGTGDMDRSWPSFVAWISPGPPHASMTTVQIPPPASLVCSDGLSPQGSPLHPITRGGVCGDPALTGGGLSGIAIHRLLKHGSRATLSYPVNYSRRSHCRWPSGS
jgi:hypothetical protein